MAAGVYTVGFENQAITTGITLLEVTAPSTSILRVTRAWLSQSNISTSSMQRIELLRKSGTITGTASPPSAVGIGAYATSGVTVKWKATGEGTDGNVIVGDSFNLLNGWLYVPVPEEQIIVPPSGIIAIKLPAAPAASTTISCGIDWVEVG